MVFISNCLIKTLETEEAASYFVSVVKSTDFSMNFAKNALCSVQILDLHTHPRLSLSEIFLRLASVLDLNAPYICSFGGILLHDIYTPM